MTLHILVRTKSDGQGGADRASMRIVRAVETGDATCHLEVARHALGDPRVLRRSTTTRMASHLLSFVDRLALRTWGASEPDLLSSGRFGALRRQTHHRGFDLLHLHWLNRGTIALRRMLPPGMPTVWTIHDMWPATGGCHYDDGCGRYRYGCGNCPLLGASHRSAQDLSRRIMAAKLRQWSTRSLHLVAPSEWMAHVLRSSPVFRGVPVRVIPNPIDLTAYSPAHRAAGRARFGLLPEDRVLAFGGMAATDDPRKGYRELAQSLEVLSGSGSAPDRLLVFGGDTRREDRVHGVATTFCGPLRSDRDLAETYAAADAFVLPSRQDNLPNTIVESLACGTPVAAFAVGGIIDLVRPGVNGHLARPRDPADLARAIARIIQAPPSERAAMREAAVRFCRERHAPTVVGAAYRDLYRHVADSAGR